MNYQMRIAYNSRLITIVVPPTARMSQRAASAQPVVVVSVISGELVASVVRQAVTCGLTKQENYVKKRWSLLRYHCSYPPFHDSLPTSSTHNPALRQQQQNSSKQRT